MFHGQIARGDPTLTDCLVPREEAPARLRRPLQQAVEGGLDRVLRGLAETEGGGGGGGSREMGGDDDDEEEEVAEEGEGAHFFLKNYCKN